MISLSWLQLIVSDVIWVDTDLLHVPRCQVKEARSEGTGERWWERNFVIKWIETAYGRAGRRERGAKHCHFVLTPGLKPDNIDLYKRGKGWKEAEGRKFSPTNINGQARAGVRQRGRLREMKREGEWDNWNGQALPRLSPGSGEGVTWCTCTGKKVRGQHIARKSTVFGFGPTWSFCCFEPQPPFGVKLQMSFFYIDIKNIRHGNCDGGD